MQSRQVKLCYPKSYKTAFRWRAYANRADSLRLLWRNKIHVDSLVKTHDGFSDTIHWQVITAFCPKLIEASKVIENTGKQKSTLSKRRFEIEFPERVNSLLTRQLLDCAYGEKLNSLNKSNLANLYFLSDEFNIEHAINICLNYAISLLNVENCIQFLLLSLKHKHHSLKRRSYSNLRKNFKIILHINRDFHLLPINYLKRLLLDDFLKLDEDEELAWIAILRWMGNSQLSTNEILQIFNRMVSAPQSRREAAEERRNVFDTFEEHQPVNGAKIVSSTPAASNNNPMRNFSNRVLTTPQYRDNIDFNFYSPPIPIQDFSCENEDSKKDDNQDDCFGLRMDSESLNNIICDNTKSEEQLIELVKCLRFFRFRSINAFNVILEHKILNQPSERFNLLIYHMKLRYIMRKKLPIDETERDGQILKEELERLKLSETGKSKRIIKSVIRLVRCRQVVSNSNMSSSIIGQRLPLQNRQAEPTSENVIPEKQSKDEVLTCEPLTLPFMDLWTLKRAANPRVPNYIALTIGGWRDGAVTDSMLAYDFVCDNWFKLNIRLPEPRAFHASCPRDKDSGEVVIFGGTNGKQILNSVISIDPSRDISLMKSRRNNSMARISRVNFLRQSKDQCLEYKFRKLRPMIEHRCHLSGVHHSDGRIYALGGHNGQQRLKTGEWFDWKSNQWHSIAEMTIARSDASACSHDNKIFIAGGQISDQFIQSSVEFYKPSDNTWTFVTPMIVPRMAFQLISYKNHLLAIGGTNGLFGADEMSSVTRSVERYNFSQSTWALCTPMNQRRSSFGVMQIENNLIVAGGFSGQERLKTCESLRVGRQQLGNRQNEPEFARDRARVFSQLNMYHHPSNAWKDQTTPNQLASGRPPIFRGISPSRRAMKWIQKASLPSKRSGFSISVVRPTRYIKEFSYHGSRTSERPTVIKQRGKLDKFKIIKRRKLVKYLKIGVVVIIVVSMM